MAIERNFITPASMTILTTANVVGNTASTDMFANTTYANTAPSLRLDFAKSRVLDSRVKFFRNSIATYEDENGIIRTVANNQPRFNFSNGVCEGLLMEETKTNNFVHELYDHGIASIAAGTAIGPDNKAAYRYIIPAGVIHSYSAFGGYNVLFANAAIGSTTDFTFTGYFGPSSGNVSLRPNIVLSAANTTATAYCECAVNVESGTVDYSYVSAPFTQIVAPTITRHINGMWKVRWTVRVTTTSALQNRIGSFCQIRAPAGGIGIRGDGFLSVQASCCQFEQGSEPSSYIPTTSTVATRDNEWAVIDGADFANFYNPHQGTIFAEGREYLNTASRGIFTINDGTANNVPYHGFIPTGFIGAEVMANGVFSLQQFGAKVSGSNFKLTQTYNGSNTIIYHNGTSIYNSANPTVNISKNVDRLIIGNSRFTNGYFPAGVMNGSIKRLYFYKNALTPEQQAFLTS